MKVHIIGSLPHHQAHCWHIWKHLPSEMQGITWTHRRVPTFKDIPADDWVLVGGFYDIDRTRGRKTIYVEHGAGQSYKGDPRTVGHPAYHGSDHPANVVGYISPRQRVADSWGRPAVAVGSPVCDDAARVTPAKVAAFSFHWDCHLLPETRSAYAHYADHLGEMVRHVRDQGLQVVATSHPRDARLPFVWRNLGVERVSVAEVRARAALLVADNTSLMYEMAHLGRSVLALDAPWYRRDVDHGLRFWSDVPGLRAGTPEAFLNFDVGGYVGSGLSLAMAKSASIAAYDRERADGRAGERAAWWIVELVEQYGRGT